MPFGTDQRRAQQPTQADREGAHPNQDVGELLVVKAAAGDRRDELFLAEPGALLGWHLGRETLQLAGDALLDLGLAGCLGPRQGALAGVARDEKGDRDADQDGEHG
jgi:hypothetical protein